MSEIEYKDKDISTIEKIKDKDKEVRTSTKEGGVPTRHARLVLDNIKRAVSLHLRIRINYKLVSLHLRIRINDK